MQGSRPERFDPGEANHGESCPHLVLGAGRALMWTGETTSRPTGGYKVGDGSPPTGAVTYQLAPNAISFEVEGHPGPHISAVQGARRRKDPLEESP